MTNELKPCEVIRVNEPKRFEIWTIRSLILIGILFMIFFLVWFFNSVTIGYPLLYYPLTFALLFKLLKMLSEWYHYFNPSIPKIPTINNNLTVDIFTTACPGEPLKMIENTLKAIQKIKYPHKTFLCDEGNDPELIKICTELNVIHVHRLLKVDAKAGNINNALQYSQSDICLILDPDHEPCPEFIDHVLPYFNDAEIGYVQVVQAYGNQEESFIARGAAEQTYHFYGPMMMGMNSFGTVQAIGANCTFRRSALDSIGGHAAGLSEDMHTAMQLHAKGWKSVYVPKILSRGLVPSTMSAFYSQQLKWSRGTFELLFRTYPSLFKKFTWRQKVHYLTLPMYFFYGMITLFDILVPVIALVTAKIPWEVNLIEFTFMFIPILGISLLIRLYAQHWLLENKERGLHLFGGILRIGTWWIYLLGFIYSIFNIKVPYIPTPKGDEIRNNLKLCLPNIIAAIVSIVAIIYGLSIDWNPYSLFMACFAIVNSIMLAFVILLGQERSVKRVTEKISSNFIGDYLVTTLGRYLDNSTQSIYRVFRNSLVSFTILLAFILTSYTMLDKSKASLIAKTKKDAGGFYKGIFIPEIDNSSDTTALRSMQKMEFDLNSSFDIVSFYQAWGPESINKFPEAMMKKISRKGGIPMITWEPWTNKFKELSQHPDLKDNRKVMKAISDGLFDSYLHNYALKISSFGEPVFLRFAHEFDNPAYPWSETGGNTPEEFLQAWKHVVTYFTKMGVSNVTWVWSPWKAEAIEKYFPGTQYVDWVGITCLNYGLAAQDSKWHSFESIYEPYQKALAKQKDICNKPVMLAEFGSTTYGGSQLAWIDNALNSIKRKHPEIKSLVFFYSNKDKNWPTSWRPIKNSEYIDWTFQDTLRKNIEYIKNDMATTPFTDRPFFQSMPNNAQLLNLPSSHCSEIISNTHKSELIIDGKPFYIQGIAYNTGDDWRNGNVPLTRRQIVADFEKIKAMGANTIRRYNPSIYDYNVLNIAHEFNLKVLYGFWFDPETDFYKDTLKVKQYLDLVEETVNNFKAYPSVLAWSIGNETWGLLKHNYEQPYLAKVRSAYVDMIEKMAIRIHEMDPEKPVLSVAEHSWQLPEEIYDFHKHAPSIDAMGVNSYYVEQISKLKEIMWQFDSTRPYLVSEFGPRGYWNPEYTKFKNDTIIVEESDMEKAENYSSQWKNFVNANRSHNLGGVAFCWRDRMEGTNTWFGISDDKGRLKPSYYTLKKNWNNSSENKTTMSSSISFSETTFIPEKKYEFSAQINIEKNENLKYEWHLYKDEFFELKNKLEVSTDGRNAIVTLPAVHSSLRLYLYVSDGKGNVTTSSEAICY